MAISLAKGIGTMTLPKRLPSPPGTVVKTAAVGGAKGGGRKGFGGELRSSLRIQRATKGLDCNITLRSRTRKTGMNAGGSFGMGSLLMLLDTHGPSLQIECSGPDAEHAYNCIAAALNGETTELTPEDQKVLEGQGRVRTQILADLPPPASSRWLDWLREDPSRTLPWKDVPLPTEHENRYPHRQAGGMTRGDLLRRLSSIPLEDMTKIRTMSPQAIEDYLCAPQDVRRKMLAAIPG